MGDFKATRTGNKITITGDVDHRINDIYDFNDDTFVDRLLFGNHRLLAQEGYATPFSVSGSKKQTLTGMMEIKNGRLINPEFRWQDTRD